jgi:hypothetical protein
MTDRFFPEQTFLKTRVTINKEIQSYYILHYSYILNYIVTITLHHCYFTALKESNFQGRLEIS